MPTIDQTTGIRSKIMQPTRALREYRMRGSNVYFGQNAIQRSTTGDDITTSCDSINKQEC
eukprot:m.160336 g.160336  ORF g.160336 m.160336 type:complete len:60 (-) comp53027_c0_seq4:1593-1772(-)